LLIKCPLGINRIFVSLMKTVVTSSDRSSISLLELRYYSGLFRYLSLRDVFVRYKQTKMGFAWSIIRPAINVLIFGVLSYLVDRSDNFSDNFLRVSAGIVFWQLLSTVINDVSNSLTANSNILTKVYFPKILLPLSGIFVCLIDFLIGFVLFLVAFLLMKGLPSSNILFLPFFLAVGIVLSFSVGLFAATASVRYRDVKFILPFIVQILFYASPVFLSSEFVLNLNIPSFLKTFYQLNPFVFLMNGFKYCIYGTFDNFDPVYAVSSIAIIFTLLILSVRYFLKFEKSFADYI
jgi:lipopolysaccharide transport system permease protein